MRADCRCLAASFPPAAEGTGANAYYGTLGCLARDGVQPVALLRGGWREHLCHGRRESWTYAIDIGSVLERLGAEIVVDL